MIEWFSWLLAGTAILAGVFCVIMGAVGRKPDDLTLGSIVLVELLLLAQVVIGVVAPLLGEHPTGHPVEFWAYLISAVIMPPLAAFWGLIERTRWSTVILGIVSLAVAVMVLRMYAIWFVQMV